MQDLIQIVGTEIEWELGEALPAIKGSLQRPHVDEQSKSAEHISTTHRPISIQSGRAGGSAPSISRLITVYDHPRTFPGEPCAAGRRLVRHPTEGAGGRLDRVPDVRC